MLELKLLGSPQILLNGQPVTGLSAAKSQALLFYLALSGRPQSRLALAGLLWPDKSDSEALANLRQALYHLRNVLPDYLESTRLTLAFKADLPCWIDVLLFEKEATSQDFSEGTIHALKTAIERYGGEFLAGFYVEEALPFEEWVVVTRERLHQLATQTLQQLAAHFVGRRDTVLGLRYTTQWLVLEPWREEAHRHKLRLLVWDGQTQAALTHYERCCAVLAEELGAEPEAETVALYEQIRNGQVDSATGRQEKKQGMLLSPLFPMPLLPALPRAVTPPHNLPAYRPVLIGRDAEVAHLCQMLLNPGQRLITLAGPSGVGKSQVALATAQRILDFGFSILDSMSSSAIENPKLVLEGSKIPNSPFPDGVWFVPLAGVTVGLPDAEGAVISAILQALQVTPVGQSTPRQALITFLQPKQLLLVLDNFDYLLAATPLLAWLIENTPQLSLLVTAQSQLHLKTEGVIHLAGLPVPVQDSDPQAMEYANIRLLRERAGRAWPTFAPATETLRSVTAICRLVEGSPLAIELVAGWVSHYPYAQIEQAIRENLALLENTLPGQPQQQHSLQAVCEFVWQRLTPTEQMALAGAAVFHGSFSRAAFLAVTKARLTDLVSLNDRALLQQEGVGRYVMHDRVREFAGEKLHTVFGGGEELRNRHGEYYANFLQACEQELKTANQRQAVAAIQLDIHNIHALWQRAIRLHHLPTLEKAQESLWYYYYLQGRSLEGEALFAAAATALHKLDTLNTVAHQPSVQHALALGQVLNWQGWFHMQMGHADEALEIIQQSLAHFAQASARMHRTMTYAHLAAGQIHRFWDEPALALPHVTQGLTHATECGDPWGMAYASFLLGPLTLPAQPYKQLARHYQGSLTIVRSIGDPLLLIDNLLLCADTAISLGDYDQAEAYLHESHQLGHDFALPAGRLSTQLCLAELDRVRGHYTEAKASSIASIHHCTEIGDDRSLTTVLRTLGLLAYAGQAYDEAKQTLQESLRLAQHSGCQWAVVLALTPLGHSYWQLGEGAQARSMLQKSVELAQQLPQRADLVALALGGLAEVETVLESYAAAEATYQRALSIAVQIEALPLILDLVVGLAALRFKTGSATPAQLVEWLALPCQHPAGTQATKERATQLLATVVTAIPSTAQGSIPISDQVLDWPTTIAAMLAATA